MTDEIGIICSVSRKVPKRELPVGQVVPASVDGVITDVLATGPFRALAEDISDPQSHMARFRPAPGGVSVAHKDVTAGTLGCLVRREGRPFILSNNHVLANSNSAALGDAILQPAPYDGGLDPQDRIALLAEFVPIRMMEHESACGFAQVAVRVLSGIARALGSDARFRAISSRVAENLVDAAIAGPLDPALVASAILGVGEIQGVRAAELGMTVQKSGRTTGHTRGRIEQVDVTADIEYGGAVARFADQLMAGQMSRPGDSGSVVLDEEGHVIGLLFAGSGSTTLMNRFEHVAEALGVEV